jgi:hypothetical protein
VGIVNRLLAEQRNASVELVSSNDLARVEGFQAELEDRIPRLCAVRRDGTIRLLRIDLHTVGTAFRMLSLGICRAARLSRVPISRCRRLLRDGDVVNQDHADENTPHHAGFISAVV